MKPLTRLGYLLRTFPVLSETFVAGEILAVAELTGQAPVVAAMHRPGEGQAGPWEMPAGKSPLYWRDIDKNRLPELILDWTRLLVSHPFRTASSLAHQAPGLSLSDRFKAVALSRYFHGHGVGHLHSHFGWEQADMLAFLSRLSGLPYSLTLHAADIFVDSAELSRRMAGAAFLVTISDFNKRLLHEHFALQPGRVHVVHCGVDLSAFAPSPPPQSPVPRLVSLARMVPKKGFGILLQALALLRSEGIAVEAELVGDGPLRPDLMQLAGELGLSGSVSFPGAVTPDQAASCLRRADVAALACTVAPDGDMDGIPVVLMEAMALGRPVVSTRLSGIPELVAEGCGLLAEPGDPGSLATQLRTMLTNTGFARECAAKGRHQVEKSFSLEAQARRIVELSAASKMAATR